MTLGNRLVSAVLRSPVHGVLSRSVALIRYRGRRSGHEVVTPVQYAPLGQDLVVIAARPSEKQWWRNFRDEHDLDVLTAGSWRPMRGRAVLGADEPGMIEPLLGAYRARFPRAARQLDPSATVAVWCRPR